MKTIVFDIDGTLADLSHRIKYLEGEKKDWDSFYGRVDEDGVIEEIAQIFVYYVCWMAPSNKVICITGRPERTREVTLKWFKEKIGFVPDELYMRKDRDWRPDVEIKKEWVEKLQKQGYKFQLAFEDRDRVVKMYRDLGIKCCQVAEGAY